MHSSSEPGAVVVRSTGRSPLRAADLIPRLIDAPLPPQFRDWLVLKGVDAVEEQDGAWRTVGGRRVLRMTDGSRISESLVAFDPELGWTNELFEFTNVIKHLLVRVEDDWRFGQDLFGTTVTWTWVFHPQPTVLGRALTRAVIAPLHRIYLQRILDQDLVEAAAGDRSADLVALR